MQRFDIVRRALLPAPEILLFALIFWLALWFMPDALNSDGDLGRHITIGNYILDTRAIPTRDVFSHTRFDAELVPHEWLSEAIFAWAHRSAGLNGVAWLTALLIALTYFVLAVGLRALGVNALIAFFVALFAYFAGFIHQLPRPHMFSLLFFTLELVLLEIFRRRGDWRILLPLPILMILWANLHGAFVFGLILAAVFGIGALLEKRWRVARIYFALLLALTLASFVNPSGAQTLRHGFGYVESRLLVDLTVEYQSPNFHNAATYPFALLMAWPLLLGARARWNAPWAHTLLVILWTLLALYSARNIPLYAQVTLLALTLPSQLWLWARAPALEAPLRNLDALAPRASGWALGVGGAALLIWLQANGAVFDLRGEGNTFRAEHFPVAAVNALEKDLPPGEMFNEFTWGGYLLYRLFPLKRVFIDGQTDFYGEALTREYLRILNAEAGWQDTLNQYDVQWVIVPPSRPLARELARTGEWREFFRDATAAIFVKE